MHRTTRLLAALAGSVILATVGTGAPTLAADPPVTLRFGTADSVGSAGGPYVTDFIEQVRLASGGSITVEPVWDAFDGAATARYQVVAKRIADGDLEMGLVPGRAWNESGVTSLQALQAPFLITDDNLAAAVAESDIAVRMLDGMTGAGVVGLSLWPEDLRHPFSFDECHAMPFVSPEDFAGTTIRALTSQVTFEMLRALGAEPIEVSGFTNSDCSLDGAESGFRQGPSLPGSPTATGNVTFFPKYNVIVIDDAAYDRLTSAQQAALREAAATTSRNAIATNPTDVQAGAAWCADGGRIVLASDEQVAAFQAATAPLYAQLEQDPLTKELIAAIRELKATTEPASAAAACGPVVAPATPGPSAAGEAATLPPNGVYRAEITPEDLEARGASHDDAARNGLGIVTWTLQGGTSTMHWAAGYDCKATYAVRGSAVRLVAIGGDDDDCDPETDDFRWTLVGDELTVVVVGTTPASAAAIAKAFLGRTWKKIE